MGCGRDYECWERFGGGFVFYWLICVGGTEEGGEEDVGENVYAKFEMVKRLRKEGEINVSEKSQ